MKNLAVIGVGFGDEGKGSFTDYLCSVSKKPLVIRFSGGHQAGHQVINEFGQHVFSCFGSGTLRNIPTYWSEFCTVEPVKIFDEFISIKDKLFLKQKHYSPVLYINSKCPITTPYDIAFNKQMEKKNKHGSCGRGIGTTFQREQDFYSLTFEDIYNFNFLIFQEKIVRIKNYYEKKGLENTDEINLDSFYQGVSVLISHKSFFIKVYDIPKGFKTHIFEGSQGLLLDQHYGFFPHVTRSNTGSKNILSMVKNPHVYLITRAYQTRHGNGFMTNEKFPHNIKENPVEKNFTNDNQGEFRRTLLDLDLLYYAIRKDNYIRETKNKSLVITCLDLIENEYRFTDTNSLSLIHSFINEKEFVEGIKNFFKEKGIVFKNIFVSNSPETKAFKKGQ